MKLTGNCMSLSLTFLETTVIALLSLFVCVCVFPCLSCLSLFLCVNLCFLADL